ncbi:MAG: hypothetical protein KDB27_00505 [Planctomycetales bacterium]|nr:hypothetical protein [Planctomycetales bacterium]
MTTGLLERQGNTITLHAPDRDITVRHGGRRAMLPTSRPDGTVGLKRARTNAEQEMVSDLEVVLATLADPGFWAAVTHFPGNTPPLLPARGRPWATPAWVRYLTVCLAGHFGSQRKAIAFFRSRHMWDLLRVASAHYIPDGYLPMPPEPVTRWQLNTFLGHWESDNWADIRHRVEQATLGSAMTRAKHLGHFNPDQPLVYDTVDLRQWAICDGTVMKAPSSRRDQNHRTDPASGVHTHAGTYCWGSKFVLAETVSPEYRGRYIIGMAHVTPQPGNTVGDEGAAAINVGLEMKTRAPGIRGLIIDTVFRGKHIKRAYDAGMVIVNHPAAKLNPNRGTGGRNADGRQEHSNLIRIHTHTLPNGHTCEHRLHAVGSIVCDEVYDDQGDLHLVPLPSPRTGYPRTNSNGTHRWYTEHLVPCRHGDTIAYIRLDDTGKADIRSWSHPDRLRYYPTNTPQFGVLYGRRNGTESVHHQWKTTAPRVPAYGAVRQTLFVLGYITTHNAVADVFHHRRAGLPNILDGP